MRFIIAQAASRSIPRRILILQDSRGLRPDGFRASRPLQRLANLETERPGLHEGPLLVLEQAVELGLPRVQGVAAGVGGEVVIEEAAAQAQAVAGLGEVREDPGL